MAKNYNELSEDTKSEVVRTGLIEGTCLQSQTKDAVLKLLMERVNNGTNIDYLVKLSEIYRNIK